MMLPFPLQATECIGAEHDGQELTSAEMLEIVLRQGKKENCQCDVGPIGAYKVRYPIAPRCNS